MVEVVDPRKLSPSAQEALGFRGVQTALPVLSQSGAARIFNVSGQREQVDGPPTSQGIKAISDKPRWRPLGSRIIENQGDWLVRKIQKKSPDELGLPYTLSTREEVGRALLAQKFSISLMLALANKSHASPPTTRLDDSRSNHGLFQRLLRVDAERVASIVVKRRPWSKDRLKQSITICV